MEESRPGRVGKTGDSKKMVNNESSKWQGNYAVK